jgi:hypothetical protein
MKSYRAILFWFGGVLTDSLAERTRAELAPGARGSAAVSIRKQLRCLSGDLALGSISPQDYCQQAALACQSDLAVSELAHRITTSAEINAPVIGLVRKIAISHPCWLVVDYPAGWYQELAARWGLPSLFPENRILYTTDLNLLRMTPEAFYLLPQRVSQPMADCLVIDPVSARAVEAMHHGLATIIYVYPARLKHELALQGIWQTEENVMHPAASERVSL